MHTHIKLSNVSMYFQVSGGGLMEYPTPSMATVPPQDNVIMGVYTCSLCTYKTGSKVELNNHVRQHTGGWPYLCSQCDYRTQRSNDLKRHMLTRHQGGVLRPYRCSYCSYRTTHAVHLRHHLVTKHPTQT